MARFVGNAGIAIGPILFVLAALGVIAMAMSVNTGGFSTAQVQDRIAADIATQANLIRAKLNECQLQYLTNGVDNSAAPCLHDAYPCSDQTNGTDVADLTCPGDPLNAANNQPNIWSGLRVSQLPPATKGFADWKYMNAGDSGGRCIWTQLGTGTRSTAIAAGVAQAASKFTSAEVLYNTGSADQKFILYITLPTGTADSHCAL